MINSLVPPSFETTGSPRISSVAARWILTLSLVMLPALDGALAANVNWANGGTGNWDNTANWSSAAIPAAGDTAVFNINTNTAVSLNGADRSITSISFGTAAGSFTLDASGSESLLLQSGGNISIVSGSTVNRTDTINAPIILGGDYSFINARADVATSLVIAGDITNSATSTLTMSGAGKGTGNLISGDISDGTGVQSVTFAHTAGKWTLSGANSYSGLTNITSTGPVVMQGSNSSAGATTVNASNAVLQLDSASNGGLASGLLTLTAGKLEALTTGRSISNAIALTAITVQGAEDLTFTGKLTGLAGASRILTNNIATGKTLTLSDIDINNDTGATARIFTLQGTGDTIIAGTIADGAGTTTANSVIIKSTGTTTLQGYSNFSGTLSTATANTVILTGTLDGPGAITTGGIFTQTSTGSITGSRSFTVGGGGTATLGGVNSYTGTTTVNQSTASLTLTGTIENSSIFVGNNGSFTQTSTGLITGTGGITVSSGTAFLRAVNSYTGTTTLNGSGVINFVSGALGDGKINFRNGTTLALQYATGNTQDISGMILSGTNTVRIDVNGNDVVFGTALESVSSNPLQGLAVISTAPGGSLTVTGVQTYNGATIIGTADADSGTLKLASGSSLAAVGNKNVMTTFTGGTFDINDNDQILSLLTHDGTITNTGTGTPTLTIGDGTSGSGRFTGGMNIIWNQDATSSALTGATGFANTGDVTLNANGVGTIGVTAANNIGTITNSGTGTAMTTISGVIGSNVTGVIQNSATSGLELSGANTYTGATTVSEGTLLISGGDINSSDVTVASGGNFIYNSSTARTGAVTLNGVDSLNRAILGGNGTIDVAITLDNLGDTLSPGNSPGALNFSTSQEWDSFTYLWEANDFTGTTPGTDFDQIAITGALDLTGGSGAYVLDLQSLTLGNLAGDVANFSETANSWTILTTTEGILNFDAANWTITDSNFTSESPWLGTWMISQAGNDLLLNYAVVPEPSAWLLLATGVTSMVFLRRRRKA